MCARFESCCTGNDLSDLGQLVFALLAEESIGGACLNRLGLTMKVLAAGSLGPEAANAATQFLSDGVAETDINSQPLTRQQAADETPRWYVTLRDKAAVIAKRSTDGPSIGSEHLLIAMVQMDGFVKDVLSQHGVQHDAVVDALGQGEDSATKIDVDFALAIDDEAQSAVHVNSPCDQMADGNPQTSQQGSAGDAAAVHALLDANLNRAREGLRVLEDCARFVLCCVKTTEWLKNIRHRLVEAEIRLRTKHSVIQRRNVEADAGTGLTTANEQRRANLKDIITANCRRMQEAIRSLEEFGKLIDSQFSASCKQLRYQTYQAEQMLESRMTLPESNSKTALPTTSRRRTQRQQRLQSSLLYVLMTEQFCNQPWKQTAEGVLAAGADILQLREKTLAAPELRRRAAYLRDLCSEHDALFFMNDDPEVAQSMNADGVHVGQSDLPVSEVRKLVDPDQLIGLSTHNLQQLNAAAECKADYVGVGPMFTTQTKSFDEYSGPAYAMQASKNANMPWFAIGGIGHENLVELIDSGVRRIAVCSTVLSAADPQNATGLLKQQLLEAGATG